jgi:hypothetical protein
LNPRSRKNYFPPFAKNSGGAHILSVRAHKICSLVFMLDTTKMRRKHFPGTENSASHVYSLILAPRFWRWPLDLQQIFRGLQIATKRARYLFLDLISVKFN